jgi:hypothetical protein
LQGVDPDTGQLVGPTIDGGDEFEIWSVALTPDALYTSDTTMNGEISLTRRDPRTGVAVGQPTPNFLNVTAGGGIVIASTVDGRIRELDPMTLQPIGAAFPATTGPTFGLAVDGNGRILMVRSDDRSLRFYDIATRTQLGDPVDLDTWPPDAAQAVLRQDGLQAAVKTGSGIVVWDLDPEHWMEAACRLAGRNLTDAEWDQYIGELAPYHQTCPQSPADTTV